MAPCAPAPSLPQPGRPVVVSTATEPPAYRLDRPTGRFLPANAAARAECQRWNEYAYQVMRQAGTLPPHWGEHLGVES